MKSNEKPPMKTIGYIVTQGGLPCQLYNASATVNTKRGGVLLPGVPVAMFTQPRDASRAIDRTARVAKALSSSLVSDWLKLTPLQSGQPYKVEPLAKQ